MAVYPCTDDPNEILDAIFEAEDNADKLDKFVNGSVYQEVQLGIGEPTPTIRNLVHLVKSAASDLDGSDVSGKFSDAANGGTTLRMLADRFGDVANIKDFGAQGDGVTDDSGAFQLAVSTVDAGTHIFIPEGVYLVSNVTINKELYFHGPATIKPIANYFNNTDISLTVAKYKNVFFFTGVAGCGLFDLDIVGDYDKDWGYISSYNNSTTSDTHNGCSLVVFLNCSDVNIKDVRYKNIILTLHNHDDFYGRMTSTSGFSPLVVSLSSNVNIFGLRCIGNMCEESVVFRSTNVKMHRCEFLSKYGHSQIGFEYCDNVQITDSRFSITDRFSENSIVNIHSRNVFVSGCYFYGGNNVDVGNESIFYWANYGNDSHLAFTTTYLVKNVRFSGCYFDNVGFLSQLPITADNSTEAMRNATYLDEFLVDGCFFNIHYDDIPEYADENRDTSYVRPVWWLVSHHGAVGNVVFSNNTINISGTPKSDRTLNDYRVFILAGTHDHKTLKITGNILKAYFYSEPSNYTLTERDGWMYIGSNWKEVHVNNNDINYPMGVTVSSMTMNSANKPFFNLFDFSGNNITGLFGLKFRDYRGFKTLNVCDNSFVEFAYSQSLYQAEDILGVNTFLLLIPINTSVGYVVVKNNTCECAKIIHIPDDYDGIDETGLTFKITVADISNNTQKFYANTQTNASNRRGIVVKNIGNTTGTICKMTGNFIYGKNNTERCRIYNFDKVFVADNVFSVCGLQTDCSFTGTIQTIKNNQYIVGASYTYSSNYTTSDIG